MSPNDEFKMLEAVTYGPVAVSICVGEKNADYKSYDGYLYEGPCEEGSTDHAILLVGYTETSYILKNSYGERWGDDGYMHIKRDAGKNSNGGTCGVFREEGVYPLVGL